MKFTKIPQDTFKNIQLNAGILLSNFDPKTASVQNGGILGATSGGVSFNATPSYKDMGEDIDNCPKNTKELKKLESMDIKMSGTFATVTAQTAKMLTAHADIDASDASHIVPRTDIKDEDFTDIWWVGDYSDENGEQNGGFCAIHMMNSLSTGGFKIQTGDKGKGKFAFEFTAHFSIADQTKVPFEMYVKAGTAEA